jgi:hypothetical protein
MRGTGKIQLKDSVYVLREPQTGQYIALRGEQPKLAPLHLATLAPADRPECLTELEELASRKLAKTGTPHELVRVDAL